MGIFSGTTRRKFLKGVAAGAAAATTTKSGLIVPAWAAEKVPPGKKLFKDVKLKYFQDSNWLHAPLWLSPHLEKEAGVGIESREQYDGGDAVAKILPQLLSKQPRFDWVQYPSLFFGAFAETGQLEPLDDYFAKYEGTQEYLDWVMPAYREFYTKWAGKTYGVMLDGDIHVLHYRKSYFENKELQDKFSKRFQQNLEVPKNWNDFLKVTQFMTEELKSQGIYGTSMVVNPPNFGWGFWMDIAASAGVNYFDEGMNPTINQGKAAEALDIYKEIVKFGPPGAEAMDIGTTIQRWVAGSDVMSVWWIDLVRVHRPAAGAREGGRSARHHRSRLEERRRLAHQPRHLAVVPHRLDTEKRAPGRQGRGVLLHLPHVAPGLFGPHHRRCVLRHRPVRQVALHRRLGQDVSRSQSAARHQRPVDHQRRHLQDLRDGARPISTPASPTSRSAIRSSSGRALPNMPTPSAATSRNRSRAS